MRTTTPLLVLLSALTLAAAGCGEDPSVPPPAPPEPAAAAVNPGAAPVAMTEPLEATPGTAVHAFSVPSIHCEGCAENIRMKVGKLEGVEAVSVSVPEHRVWVRVKELGLPGAGAGAGEQADVVAKAITAAGYEATALEDPAPSAG